MNYSSKFIFQFSVCIVFLLLTAHCSPLTAQLRVSTSDGLTNFNGVNELVFPPGSVTINGRQARIGVGGSSGVPGSGISALNGMLGTSQSFSRANDTNVNLTITSASNIHTFTVSWSGTLAKARQHASTVYTDQANTFGAFLQKFQAGNNFNLVDPTDTTKVVKFNLSNIGTGQTREVNVPNADSTTVQADTGSSNNFLTAISAQGVISKARPQCSNLSDAAASCATDATNAANISSGTLPDGRFPATLPAASGANLTALNATNLGSGTVPDARFPATLPAASGANLTNLNATNLASGTVPDGRFPATLPAASGANLTNLSASNISSGSLSDSRLSANVPLLNAANNFTSTGNHSFAGQTGFGTTAPLNIVTIKGTSGDASYAANNGLLTVWNSNAVQLSVGAQVGAPYGFFLQTKDNNNGGPYNYPILLNPVNGNVGVGTTSPARELTVNGGVQLSTAISKPTCNSTNRGTFWVTQGGAGVKDAVEVCAKDAADAYAWRTLY